MFSDPDVFCFISSALEWVDLAVLSRPDFEDLMNVFPRERLKIEKYAETKIRKWKLIRSREKQRKRESRRASKNEGHRSRGMSEASDREESPKGTSNEKQRVRRRSQSDNSHLSSTTGTRLSLSERTDTKSISMDIRRYRNSIRARSLNVGFGTNLDLSVSMVDDTTKKKDLRKGPSFNSQAPRQRSDVYRKMGNGTGISKTISSDFLAIFPNDVILKRLCRMRKEMEILETSWAGHLERRDAQEQLVDEKGDTADQMAAFLSIIEADDS